MVEHHPEPARLQELKEALYKAWDEIPMKSIRAMCQAVPERIQACIDAAGGHFE